MWWQDAVIYQVYPRSFQDSDGDGDRRPAGDRVAARPPRVARRGRALAVADLPVADADMGYDVADYKGVDPRLRHARRLRRAWWPPPASAGCACCSTSCPCHTSIEHPWFREHPDWYIWSRRARTTGWRRSAARRGRATSERALVPALVLSRAARPRLAQPGGGGGDAGRAALLDRARRRRLPRGRDRPPAEGPASCATTRRPRSRSRCRCSEQEREARASPLAQRAGHRPEALATHPRGGGRRAAGGRGLPAERAVAAVPRAPRRRVRVRAAARAVGRRARCARRSRRRRRRPRRGVGALEPRLRPAGHRASARENARAAALLLLTLPGPAFVYQGDEIGLADGPGGEPPYDRAGRDRFRHPMQWDALAERRLHDRRAVAAAPWTRAERNVADQRDDPRSMLVARSATCIALRRRAGRRVRAARRRAAACWRTAAASTRRRERDRRGAAGAGRRRRWSRRPSPGALGRNAGAERRRR